MPRTPSVPASVLQVLNIGSPPWQMARRPDKAFGWVVTVTTPDAIGATANVWYAACPEKVAAIEAVKRVTNDPSAAIEISREMSETLMTSFGLKNGQVKCFD